MVTVVTSAVCVCGAGPQASRPVRNNLGAISRPAPRDRVRQLGGQSRHRLQGQAHVWSASVYYFFCETFTDEYDVSY